MTASVTHVMAVDLPRCWWFDPRTGMTRLIGETANSGRYQWPEEKRIMPGQGSPDWVLVIDDAEMNYPGPGQRE